MITIKSFYLQSYAIYSMLTNYRMVEKLQVYGLKCVYKEFIHMHIHRSMFLGLLSVKVAQHCLHSAS